MRTSDTRASTKAYNFNNNLTFEIFRVLEKLSFLFKIDKIYLIGLKKWFKINISNQ
jgi:hypothetical protein